MTYTTEQLNQKFNNLPEELQDFIMSDEVNETVMMIAEEYGITDQQLNDFALAVFAVTCGEINVVDLSKKLTEEFKLEREIVSSVIIDLDELIFEPAEYILNEQVESEDELDQEAPKTETPVEIKKVETPKLPMIDTKLTSISAVPPQEVKKNMPPLVETPKYNGSDPYREPLE